MSLLNDALRKKRGERYSVRGTPNPQFSSPGIVPNRKRQWIALSGGIILLAAVSAVWLYLQAAPSAPGRTMNGPSRDLGVARADDGENGQTVFNPLTASQDSGPVQVVPAIPVADASEVSAVPIPGSPASAEKSGSSPAPPTMASDPDSSRMKEGPSLKPAGTPFVLETQSSVKSSKPVPQAGVADAVDGEHLRESDRLFQRACQFHRRNRLDQAISLYKNVVEKDPRHAQARFNLVAAYLQTGAYTQAFPLAAELYAEDPANQQVLLNLAIAHIGCGRYRSALDLLEKSVKRSDAPLFEIVFHKAVALGRLGRSEPALACYRQAETLRPDDPRLLFNMAVVYDQQQQFGTAVKYYLKYLEHVQEKDTEEIKQVRRRIRTLQAYGAEEKLKEKVGG